MKTADQPGQQREQETDDGVLVEDVMRPLPACLTLEHSVIAALEFMDIFEMHFLVVVAPTTGRLLGVVTRRSLERSCERRGHDPESCPLLRHLKTDIDFCLETERLDEVFGRHPAAIAPPGGRLPAHIRRRNAIPVIVVDEYKIPVGLLKRPPPEAPPPED